MVLWHCERNGARMTREFGIQFLRWFASILLCWRGMVSIWVSTTVASCRVYPIILGKQIVNESNKRSEVHLGAQSPAPLGRINRGPAGSLSAFGGATNRCRESLSQSVPYITAFTKECSSNTSCFTIKIAICCNVCPAGYKIFMCCIHYIASIGEIMVCG